MQTPAMNLKVICPVFQTIRKFAISGSSFTGAEPHEADHN
jgi:hypothetical protein